MLTFLACIALIDLGLGFYVGTFWILPIAVGSAPRGDQQQHERPDHHAESIPAAAEPETIPAAVSLTNHVEAQDPNIGKSTTPSGTPAAKHSWQAAASSARNDIAALHDRIRYAITANDKQLAKELAADIRARSRMWQKQMQDLLAQLTAEHEQEANTQVDLLTPELCLAQIETVQTNLELLDWSEGSETNLEKLQRELASINKLLPVSG